MAEKEYVALTISVTPEEHRQIEEAARRRGYNTAAEYVRALIESDVEATDQAYFWTEEWQAAEREADADIAAGRVETFGTMDELIADLMDDE
jgi:Arc/MetJ-type ribon-helix-helix transcriptional regulator